jgi:putative transcriptional regulator
MTTKPKHQSAILVAVHESAADLHLYGFFDKRKMKKFDALCLPPIQPYSSDRIRALREQLQLSQAVL